MPAIPRGEVPLAAEVAAALRSPLDVFIVRRVGTPGHEEVVMDDRRRGRARDQRRCRRDVNLTENRMKSMRSCGQ